MSIDKKSLIKEGILGILGSLFLGFLGLLAGVGVGGSTYGVPSFGGTEGWEAGGVIGGLIGISLGSLLGVWIIATILKTQGSWKGAVLGFVVGGVLNFILYDYNMPLFFLIFILVLPTIFVMAGYHLLFRK